MASIDDLQRQHEERLTALVNELAALGTDSTAALVRALIHKAVHLAAERKVPEFCGVASFLGEMIGHAHQLMHGADQDGAAHRDVVH